MLDGVYRGEVDTKLGKKSGTVVLATQGDMVAIDLEAPIVGKQELVGKANGDSFTADGSVKVPFMGSIDYTVEGKVEGDTISAVVHTSKGNMKLTGTRM